MDIASKNKNQDVNTALKFRISSRLKTSVKRRSANDNIKTLYRPLSNTCAFLNNEIHDMFKKTKKKHINIKTTGILFHF